MSKQIGHPNMPACTGVGCMLKNECARYHTVWDYTKYTYFFAPPIKYISAVPKCEFYIERLGGKSFVAIDEPK